MNKIDIIAAIEKMSILELNELVKAIEEKFGVSAAAPVAAASQETEEKAAPTSVTVTLKSAGANKIAVIKVIREITSLGLMEAKSVAEKTPSKIKENIKPEEAQEIADKLKAAGAEVEVK